MKLEVKQLSECPDYFNIVGRWIYNEWWSKRYDSPEVVLSWLRTHTKRDSVPYTVVALANGQPVGSCSIIENDCIHRPQYAPWVAAVYVRPEFRHNRIASSILQEAASIAGRANVKGLYIDCLAITAPVYAKNGWVILEREVGDKDSVVMLRKMDEHLTETTISISTSLEPKALGGGHFRRGSALSPDAPEGPHGFVPGRARQGGAPE
jgi:GNAT superfamily N-acetyltransferase